MKYNPSVINVIFAQNPLFRWSHVIMIRTHWLFASMSMKKRLAQWREFQRKSNAAFVLFENNPHIPKNHKYDGYVLFHFWFSIEIFARYSKMKKSKPIALKFFMWNCKSCHFKSVSTTRQYHFQKEKSHEEKRLRETKQLLCWNESNRLKSWRICPWVHLSQDHLLSFQMLSVYQIGKMHVKSAIESIYCIQKPGNFCEKWPGFLYRWRCLGTAISQTPFVIVWITDTSESE